MAINWFPGHMARTLRDIKNITQADALIEVVDARAIKTSSNNELTQGNNKPKLTIAMKSDLADLSGVKFDSNTLVGTIKDKKFKNQIISKLDAFFCNKRKSLIQKGMVNPEFCIVVVGLPNVGKSSLINFLSSKNRLIVANQPGVTRNKQLVRINDSYLLYDTPGVLVKKIENQEDGYKLALIGTIKKEVLPLDEVIEWGYHFLSKHYFKLLQDKYGLLELPTFGEFINFICQKYKFLLNNSLPDKNRAIEFLYKDWMNNLKVNYEK